MISTAIAVETVGGPSDLKPRHVAAAPGKNGTTRGIHIEAATAADAECAVTVVALALSAYSVR